MARLDPRFRIVCIAMICVFLFREAIKRTTAILRCDHGFEIDTKRAASTKDVARNKEIRRIQKLPLVARGEKPGIRLKIKLLRGLKAVFFSVAVFHIWYISTTTILVACFAFVDPAATTLSVYRKYIDGWTIIKPVSTALERIPKTARRMLVSIEDYKFYEHHGIDFEAFARALEVNQQIGQPMYGGSTLTMQTARTLFLVPVKSYLRKYLEVIVAFELEILLSKERILELYFSWAEWGKGVFGIEAASKLYNKAPVAKLNATQMARLMAVLSSPVRFTPATLGKSKLLTWRYEFLLDRYVR